MVLEEREQRGALLFLISVGRKGDQELFMVNIKSNLTRCAS